MKGYCLGLVLYVRPLVIVVVALCAVSQVVGAQTASDPTGAEREYAGATGLLNRGLNEMAATEYRKFLAAHSTHEKAPLARYGLGVALFRLQQFKEAERELKPLASLNGFEFAAEALLVRSQCLLAGDHAAEASMTLVQLLDHHADHAKAPDASAMLVESLYRAGDIQQVRKVSERFSARWPQHPLRERVEYLNGIAAVALKDFAFAAAVFEGMQRSYPKGQFAGQVALLLAQCWHQAGDAQQALGQYERVIKQNDDHTVADAMFGQASLLQARGDADQAAKVWDRFLQRFPTHRLAGTAHLQRGRIHFGVEKYKQAKQSLQDAAAAGAPQDEVTFWLAKCSMRQNDFATAATQLATAINANPASALLPELTYDLAMAQYQGGDLEKAASTLATFRKSFARHALAPDALYRQAAIAHAQRAYAKSTAFCHAFTQAHADHSLAAANAFLSAENHLLAGEVERAAAGYRAHIATYPNDANARIATLRLGTALHRMNQFDEATQALKSIADGRKTLQPYRLALWLLGDMCFQNEQWNEAHAFMSDYVHFGIDQPSADDALLKMGLAEWRMNHIDEALASLMRLTTEFPNSVHHTQAQFEQGQILLAKKDFADAAQAFQQVLDRAGDSRFAPFAMNHLAAIAMQRGQYERAAELFAQVADDPAAQELADEAAFQRGQALFASKQYAAAAHAFASFARKAPAHARAPMAHAQHALALSKSGESVEALKVIAAIENKFASALDPATLATLKYEKAWCLRETNRHDDAAATYRELIAAHSDQSIAANAALELAEIDIAAKRFGDAEQTLAQLHRQLNEGAITAPADVKEPVHYRLAACAFELQKFDDAAQLLEAFIASHPESVLRASALAMCGESFFKSGKFNKAASHFAALIEKHQADPACATAMLRMGECHAVMEQWPQSEKSFTAFLKRFTNHDLWFQAQFGVAWALENQSQYDNAIAAYRIVTEKHAGPTAARAQFQLGECLYAQRQYEQAVRELLKVDILYAYPEWSAAALYEAGRCFEELGKPIEARTQFEQVQQKAPNSRWAVLAAQRMNALASGAQSGG